MPNGGLVALWGGLTGVVGGLPERLDDTFGTLKWMGIGAVVVVGVSLLVVSLSFFTGKQNIASIVSAAR